MTKASSSLRRMAVSALFLSIALVLKTFFSFQIPLFGQNGMSVGISGVFSMMPSLLFGPFYGAAVSGLSDLLGYLIKPTGAFMPLLTLTAALSGFLRGLSYRGLRRRSDRGLRWAVILLSVLLLAAGLPQHRPESSVYRPFSGMPPSGCSRRARLGAGESREKATSPVCPGLVARKTLRTRDPVQGQAGFTACPCRRGCPPPWGPGTSWR